MSEIDAPWVRRHFGRDMLRQIINKFNKGTLSVGGRGSAPTIPSAKLSKDQASEIIARDFLMDKKASQAGNRKILFLHKTQKKFSYMATANKDVDMGTLSPSETGDPVSQEFLNKHFTKDELRKIITKYNQHVKSEYKPLAMKKLNVLQMSEIIAREFVLNADSDGDTAILTHKDKTQVEIKIPRDKITKIDDYLERVGEAPTVRDEPDIIGNFIGDSGDDEPEPERPEPERPPPSVGGGKKKELIRTESESTIPYGDDSPRETDPAELRLAVLDKKVEEALKKKSDGGRKMLRQRAPKYYANYHLTDEEKEERADILLELERRKGKEILTESSSSESDSDEEVERTQAREYKNEMLKYRKKMALKKRERAKRPLWTETYIEDKKEEAIKKAQEEKILHRKYEAEKIENKKYAEAQRFGYKYWNLEEREAKVKEKKDREIAEKEKKRLEQEFYNSPGEKAKRKKEKRDKSIMASIKNREDQFTRDDAKLKELITEIDEMKGEKDISIITRRINELVAEMKVGKGQDGYNLEKAQKTYARLQKKSSMILSKIDLEKISEGRKKRGGLSRKQYRLQEGTEQYGPKPKPKPKPPKPQTFAPPRAPKVQQKVVEEEEESEESETDSSDEEWRENKRRERIRMARKKPTEEEKKKRGY